MDSVIQPPPRATPTGIVLICFNAILLSIFFCSPAGSNWPAGLALLLLIVTLIARDMQATHLALLTVFLALLPLLHPALFLWPWRFLVPFAVYLCFVFPVPPLKSSLLWFRRGRLGRPVLLLIMLTAVISGLALFLWVRLLHPDLSAHLRHLHSIPPWLYPAAGLGFALGNAVLEETIARGVFMQALEGAFGPGILSIVTQAWIFGAMHYQRGFPNGTGGMIMAGCYGIMLGMIRHRSRGMVAPVITHVCADLVIFAILAALFLRPGQHA